MKYSTKLSDSIHLLLFIYLNPKDNLSSSAIAESIKTNPAYIRQLMSALKKADLIHNTQGVAAPVITRDLSEITFYDMYQAIEGDKPLLHLDTHTNPLCGVGINIQFAIGDFYDEIQDIANEKMKQMTMQDVLKRYEAKIENGLDIVV
ncbi:MAG: Rrf2 family transcriptional regulator [Lachnospiraceae bacterium]|nr:Rrf2 family transcriptional regulator [Lachnospiraceae bacterium]MDD3616694.1 Rrf2 family transcriptional regulator [Lachnospiraceae bacterium]